MTPARSKPRFQRPVVIILALALLAGGIVLESSVAFRPAKQALQAKHTHRSAFPGNRTLRLFNQMGVVHLAPDRWVPKAEKLVTRHGERTGTINFWGVAHGEPEMLPSADQVPTALLESGVPILSIYLKNREWRRLRNTSYMRGRESERSAFVSFFDQGQHQFSSGAGIRPHGGTSRPNPELNSYRLYLRGIYGADRFPAGLLGPEQIDPLRRIVLRDDLVHFVLPLAFDIARQAGALAPVTRPAALIINGEQLGIYALTEYLDANYITARYNHSRFTLVRTKSQKNSERFQSGDRAAYEDFLSFAATTSGALDEVSDRVDLDNLSRWFISLMICATGDPFQGLLVRDDSQDDGRWFWINWDMDHSIISANPAWFEKPWEEDIYRQIVSPGHKDPRNRLLRVLIQQSREYRSFLLRLFVETVNHRVTGDFLAERVDHYEESARAFGLNDRTSFEHFRKFFAERMPLVRERLGAELRGGASHNVHVSIPEGRTVEIDGFPKSGNYGGWYYETVPVALRVPERAATDFSHWLVNDQVIRSSAVELDVETELNIVAVFRMTGQHG